MPKALTLAAFIAAGLGVLLGLGALAAPVLLNSDFLKQRAQARIARSFELDLEFGGRLELSYFPGLQFTFNELRFTRQGSAVATVRQARIGVDLWPLLHKVIRVDSITLQEPRVHLERYADGTYNVRKPAPRVMLNLAHIQVADATFRFNDALRGTQYEASTCKLELDAANPLTRDSRNHLDDLAMSALFNCAEIRKDELALTDVSITALAQAGVLRLEPVSMQLFAGHGTGHVEADFTGTVPAYQLAYTLPQFHINELFRLFTPQTTPEGTVTEGALFEGLMGFATTLSAQGQTLPATLQTLSGSITLRGEDLVINGADLDERLARYESSQNFNLVDAGAFLLAGPLGLALTKGYNFANIFLESGIRSEVPSFVSDWDVNGGVAQARYVMMTTAKNRIALKGGLDLSGEHFDDVTIALLDEAGCARIEQGIQGSFRNPVIDKPTVLRSLAGPVRTLLQKLIPAEPCEAFHAVGRQ